MLLGSITVEAHAAVLHYSSLSATVLGGVKQVISW